MSTAADQPTATLAMVTLDCADPGPVSAFYADLLGLDVAYSDEDAVMLTGSSGGPALGFGRVADYEPPAWPNPKGSKQYHLDLAVTDIPAARLAQSSWVRRWPTRSRVRPGGCCSTRPGTRSA